MMNIVGKGISATTERRRRIYRQVKPRLQRMTMRVQAVGVNPYSPCRGPRQDRNRIVPALSFTSQSPLAITTVVQELFSFGRSRAAAIRISRLGRSPRTIGQ